MCDIRQSLNKQLGLIQKCLMLMFTHSTIDTIKKVCATKCTDFYRGRDQIRTDVRAFAEPCLATRPPDHFKRLQR